MQGDDPPYLSEGTAVSAKYKGAFCEAKVSKVVRLVKCKVTFKAGLGIHTVTNENIKGTLRVGQIVQARHPEKKEYLEAIIAKIQDCSQYTVVFDDGDITTLRRTALCLKSGRHFNESETLDQLPLTHPEHFGNPVIGGRRGRRRLPKDDSSDDEPEEENDPDLGVYSRDIGRVVCIEASDKKRAKDNWFPGLIVVPSAQPTVRINAKDEYLVRSFKDGRYYTVPKKEISDFDRQMGSKVESTVLAEAVDKALKYLDKDELPVHWERNALFNIQSKETDSEDNFTDSSDEDGDAREKNIEQDCFVAQLLKFMEERKTPLNDMPSIGNKDVDLYRLFRIVHKLGGYNRVTNQKKWCTVTIRLGFSHNHATYNQVKQVYKKCLSSFENFYRKLGCTMNSHSRSTNKNKGRSLIRDRDRITPVSSPHPEKQDPDKDSEKERDPPEREIEKIKKEEVIKVEDIKKEKEPVPEKTVQSYKRHQREETPHSSTRKKEREIKEEKELKRAVSEASDTNSSDDAGLSESSAKTSEDSRPIRRSDSKLSSSSSSVKDKKVKVIVKEEVKSAPKKIEVKKEEPEKEDDKEKQPQSKTKTPVKNKDNSPERPPPDTKTPLRDSATKNKLVKKSTVEDEKAKRGRKRTITEDKNSQSDGSTTDSSVPPPVVSVGHKLKVYYGPTHDRLVTYEAKVVDVTKDSTGTVYRVHYTGWNTRYDEWIKPSRIAENLSLNLKNKRLQKQNASNANKNQPSSTSTTPSKPTAAKRGRGMSTSNRREELPRSTTPSSVTSSSSRTKSPATPMTRQSRSTRQGETRRTRRTSIQTDISIPSESESESDNEGARTRSTTRIKEEEIKEEPAPRTYKKKPVKRKEDNDTEKEDEEEVVERPKRTKRIIKSAEKSSADSEYDYPSPPKGRDIDLNEICHDMKGFNKIFSKISSTDTSEKEAASSDDSSSLLDMKIEIKEEKVEEEKKREKSVESTLTSEDIYEFKEPEPFEYESRTKLTDDKSAKKRLVPRLFDDLEKPVEKTPSPKKKPVKSPAKENSEEKKKMRRTPVKKDLEESKSNKEESPIMSKSDDPFDKLVESPSFNITPDKKPQSSAIMSDQQAKKVVKTLNLDEPLNLFGELPEETGEDSGDRLQLFDGDDGHSDRLFTHEEQLFSDNSFGKSTDSFSLDAQYAFNSKSNDSNQKSSKDDDTVDPIDAAIQRVINAQSSPTDEDSEDDLLINHPTNSYAAKKSKTPLVKSTPLSNTKPTSPSVKSATPSNVKTTLSSAKSPSSTTKTTTTVKTLSPVSAKSPQTSSRSEPTPIPEPPTKETKVFTKEPEKVLKPINPALQETSEKPLLSSLAALQSEVKKEELKDITIPPIKTCGTKIADSILQKFNQIKSKAESSKATSTVSTKATEPLSKVTEKIEAKKEKDVELATTPVPPPMPKEESKPAVAPLVAAETKKRPGKKFVSKEFIDSDSDSSDSEDRLVIARSDDESQTSDKNLDAKDTDSNASLLQATTDDSQERNFKFDLSTTSKSDASNPSELSSELPKTEELKSDSAEGVKDEEPDSNISLLLCKETIPGSPAPASEGTSAAPEPTTTRNKPKSAKNLLSEMPFASAPGNSNKNHHSDSSSASKPNQDKEVLQQQQHPQQQQQQQQLLAVPLEAARDVVLEASTVMDNTPPTTPESTLSNLSPHRDGDMSPNTADNESGKSMDAADLDFNSSSTVQRRNLSSSKVSPYSEEDTLTGEPQPSGTKKNREEASPCKKRRKSCKGDDSSSQPSKRGRKPNIRSRTNSDSDDNSEHSIPGSTNILGGSAGPASLERESRLARSPRPSKYNFFVNFDPQLDSAQRIAVLQQKLTELRKTYSDVKAELACIERRRKKLRRREREALKAAKQDLACT